MLVSMPAMITGTRTTPKPPNEAVDRFCTILAGANGTVTDRTDQRIEFRHGTYLTESAPLLPKKGFVSFVPSGEGTKMDYGVAVDTFPTLWIGAFGILFCWLVFPAVAAYRALKIHPKRMIENLLAGV